LINSYNENVKEILKNLDLNLKHYIHVLQHIKQHNIPMRDVELKTTIKASEQ